VQEKKGESDLLGDVSEGFSLKREGDLGVLVGTKGRKKVNPSSARIRRRKQRARKTSEKTPFNEGFAMSGF